MLPQSHEGALPAPREPHLEARVYTLEDLLRDVLAGKIRAPDHEASKWTAEDAERLLDSVHRGYPIGALLLWQQPDAGWVVDGQQRVRALTRVLAGAGLGADTFALHLDLDELRIVRLGPRTRPTARYLPLTELLDSERLLRWLRDHRPGQPAAAILRFGSRLRAHPIPVQVVHTDDESVVREIYRRLHTTGHPMRERAVFDALAIARFGRPPRRLGDLSDSLSDLQFGTFEDSLLVTTLHVLCGSDGVKPSRDQLATVQLALRTAVHFLRQDAEIPHRTLIPEDFTIHVLTIFFARFPRPHPRSRELLARWLWRHALTQPTAPVDLPRTLTAVRRGDENEALQALLAAIPRTPVPTIPLRPFAPATLRGRLLALAMYDLRPRHLIHGGALPPSLPRRLLSRAPLDRQHDLANRIFHPTVPGGLIAAILRSDDPAALASHAIDKEAIDRLRDDDAAGFSQPGRPPCSRTSTLSSPVAPGGSSPIVLPCPPSSSETTTDMELEVLLGDVPVGVLRRSSDRGDATRFRFYDSYRQLDGRPVLGQAYEDYLTEEWGATQRLPPFFSNLLPEGPMRERLAAQLGIHPDRELYLLAHLGRDLPGAVIVRSPTPIDAIDEVGPRLLFVPGDRPRQRLVLLRHPHAPPARYTFP